MPEAVRDPIQSRSGRGENAPITSDPNQQTRSLNRTQGGSATAAASQDSLANFNGLQDPALITFLRSQGVGSSQRALEEIQRRIDGVNRARQRGIDDLNRSELDAQRGTDTSFEARGLFRSGLRHEERGRTHDAANVQRGRVEEDAGLQLEAIERARAGIRSGSRTRGSGFTGGQENQILDSIRRGEGVPNLADR